jgi:segregation and condensation protein B
MITELESIIEGLIFASPEGASTKELVRCVKSAVATVREAEGENASESVTRHASVTEEDIAAAIGRLNLEYIESGRAFQLVERPAGWRIVSRPDWAQWVRELFPDKKPQRLTPSALETLAIIAYRQPMTKSGIEAVRGVSVDGPLQTLMDRNVVRIAGRADLPGRPLLYETTELFLEHFGVRTIDDLPNAAELRSVKLPEPEAPAAEVAAGSQDELTLGEGGEAVAKKKPRKKKAEKVEGVVAEADAVEKPEKAEKGEKAEKVAAAAEEEETVVFLEAEDEVVAEEGAEETGEGGEG